MLITFRELLSRVPISERTLRTVIAELGFQPAPGRHRLYFSEKQVKQIEEALACRSTEMKARRAYLTRQSREVMERVIAEQEQRKPSREEVNRLRAMRARQSREIGKLVEAKMAAKDRG